MSTSSIIWIIVAVVVVIAIVAALLWVARNRRDERRHIEAEQIREDVADKSLQVGEREARQKRQQPKRAWCRQRPTPKRRKRLRCNIMQRSIGKRRRVLARN